MHVSNDNFMGERLGVEQVTISIQAMPSHAHGLEVSDSLGTQTTPNATFPAVAPIGLGYVYESLEVNPLTNMSPQSISITGDTQAHQNLQPYLALNYVIATVGTFPQQG